MQSEQGSITGLQASSVQTPQAQVGREVFQATAILSCSPKATKMESRWTQRSNFFVPKQLEKVQHQQSSPVFCSASDANGHITPQHLCIPHREALVSPSKNGPKKSQHTKTHCVCIPADRNMVLCRYLRSYFHRKKCREQLFNDQLCTTIPIRSTRRHRSIKPDHVDRQTYARRNPTSILTRPSEKEKSNQKKQPRG